LAHTTNDLFFGIIIFTWGGSWPSAFLQASAIAKADVFLHKAGTMTLNTQGLMSRIATIGLAALSLTLVACGGSSGGGSGGSGSTPPPASIVVQPSSFDFGLVTEGNLDEVPARRFTIRNNGTSSYEPVEHPPGRH
jgi:hypothetical protein